MIIKTISGGHHTATAVLTEETKFVFADNWSYFHAKNLSADTAYLSMTSGGSAGDDGVIAVPGGETACIRSVPVNAVYAFAEDTAVTVQIDASDTVISPFKSAAGGGEAYVLPIAATNTLGGIKPDGTTITVNSETGVASAVGSSYTLPAASAETLGGVKVGTGLSVTAEGVLSASGGGGITETLLFDGATNNTDVYTLSAAYTGFKFLIISAIYSGTSLYSSIINCTDIRATSDYSKTNYYYSNGDRVIMFNNNGVNFKSASILTYCKIYGVN